MESDEVDDEFFFESSHLALRSSRDYIKLMRHLTVLCSQRIKVQKDIEVLSAARERALANPNGFVEELTSGLLDLPTQMSIPEVSFIHPRRKLRFIILYTLDTGH